jgi:hypothetical protein
MTAKTREQLLHEIAGLQGHLTRLREENRHLADQAATSVPHEEFKRICAQRNTAQDERARLEEALKQAQDDGRDLLMLLEDAWWVKATGKLRSLASCHENTALPF